MPPTVLIIANPINDPRPQKNMLLASWPVVATILEANVGIK